MSNSSDYSLANQSHSNYRSEHNTILGDIQSGNLGAVAPSTLVPGKIWMDSSGSELVAKIRDKANAADLTIIIDNNTVVSIDQAVVINESGADKDFRVESGSDANMLFCDASTNRVGIGTSTPSAAFNVEGAVVFNDAGVDVDFRVEGVGATAALFVQGSDGFVSIGKSFPLSDLHIDLQAASTLTTLGGALFLEAFANAGSGNYGASLVFGSPNGGVVANRGASIMAIQDTASSNTVGLTFNVHASGSGDPRVEAMRIASTGDVSIGLGNLTVDSGFMNYGAGTELTIAAGVVTATQRHHKIDTELDAGTDDLDTILGGTAGDETFLRQQNSGRVVTVTNAGNIITRSGGDQPLTPGAWFFFAGTSWIMHV